MKKYLIVLAICLLGGSVFGQQQTDLIQPDKSIQVITGAFHSNIDTLRRYDNAKVQAKGFMVKLGVSADGQVEVHLINDPAGTWVIYPAKVGYPTPVIFDMIRSTNTTIVLDSIVVFYK